MQCNHYLITASTNACLNSATKWCPKSITGTTSYFLNVRVWFCDLFLFIAFIAVSSDGQIQNQVLLSNLKSFNKQIQIVWPNLKSHFRFSSSYL